MGILDIMTGDFPASSMIDELRKAFADMLAEQKKTNDILSKLLEDLSDGQ